MKSDKKSGVRFTSIPSSIILFLFLIILNTIYPQTLVSKRGGICFRTDDNKSISQYLEYASIFNKYKRNFCLAINLGNSITPAYLEGLKQIQGNGHEIMDHTPKHVTNYFTTILTTDYYKNHPGVYRRSGNKIELKHTAVNTAYAKRTGYVNINGDVVTSTEGIFSDFATSDCYLYFPLLNRLVYIDNNSGWIDQNTVKVMDFWCNSINLGIHENVQFYNFDYYNIHITIDGIKALGEETLRLADYYNLEKPDVWIHPGGHFPHINRIEINQALGDGLNFKCADVKTNGSYSLKVFNEYNPDNDKQFGMFWGDFRDDSWTFEQCKEVIANRVAKHHVLIGHSHFNELLDGWSGFLDRTEQLIQWCIQNDIPIRTYSQWADILYSKTPDPDENAFPPLNVDLDLNNIPDGYNSWGEGSLIKNDGAPTVNEYCYSINKVGEICSITELGGIEKGENEFEIWTKGAPGNYVEVTFKISSQNEVYKFPATNSEWTKYDLSQSVNGNTTLNIRQNISRIDVIIRCSNYSSGSVKVSGMNLAKTIPLPVELFYFSAAAKQSNVNLMWETKTEVNNYGFEVQRASSSTSSVPDETSPVQVWERIGFVEGNGNSNSPRNYFFTDKNPAGGSKFVYRLKQIDNDGTFAYSNKVEVDIILGNYELFQNYPNPFNPVTSIKFSLPENSNVKLNVFNVLGEHIATLLNKDMEAGFYIIPFDASNLSSGTYIYRIDTKIFSQTKKMLVLK